MTSLSAFIYHDEYLKYQFGTTHPFKPIREKYTLDILRELGVFNEEAKIYEPEPATDDDLALVHTRDYIDYVKRMCEEGSSYLDYGDTPATKGLYEGACRVVGGSILSARLILEGEVNHTFNPGGGLHHAQKDRAAGFCVFNDVAITVRYLQNAGIQRIAIVDIDGHHGDGTQMIFYREPILKISSHRIGIFPGTGYLEEVGVDKGLGYSVNIPLQEKTDDDTYLYAFQEIVPPLLESYQPEIIITQFGVDGHYGDPLVGLSLTTRTYMEVASIMHNLAHKLCDGRLLLLGGGGYDIANTARCWAIMFVTVCGGPSTNHIARYNQLFDKPVPRKEIQKNTQEFVREIKNKIFPLHHIEY